MNLFCLFCEFQKVGLNGSTSDIFSFLHLQLENLHVYPSKFQSFSFPSAVERLFTFAVFKSLFHSILATKCGRKKTHMSSYGKWLQSSSPVQIQGPLNLPSKKGSDFNHRHCCNQFCRGALASRFSGVKALTWGHPKVTMWNPARWMPVTNRLSNKNAGIIGDVQ